MNTPNTHAAHSAAPPVTGHLIPLTNEESLFAMHQDTGVSDCCHAHVVRELLHVWCGNCGDNCDIVIP